MLDQITPLILTLDEEANIGRTLERLGWARDIVVVDSGSTDGTRALLTRFSNVRCVEHEFESHSPPVELRARPDRHRDRMGACARRRLCAFRCAGRGTAIA